MQEETISLKTDPWLYDPDFFEITRDGKHVYEILREELNPFLTQGTIKVMGKTHQERRQTCFFTTSNTAMVYSGRTLDPIAPPKGSYIELLLLLVSSQDFRDIMEQRFPQLKGLIPEFNAVFFNYYRPPSETDKPDALGAHSDVEKYLASPVILSVTYCSHNGARLFKFHKKPGTTTYKEFELQDGSALWMLPTCQTLFKHSVSDRKNNLAGEKITGGRINATFRCVKKL